jgi:hypothetical protein
MSGRDGCKEILQKVLGWAKADKTEALIIAQDISLTRFCNSAINQNVSEKRGTLFIRIVVGRRIDPFSTHRFDDQAIQRGFERARLQPPTAFLRFLPRPEPLERYNRSRPYDGATARYSPSQRAEDPKGLSPISGDRINPFLEAVGEACTTRGSNPSQSLR